ncbi:hypothetical protein Hanom_Chr12g01143091 [Helianthus anomalus]
MIGENINQYTRFYPKDSSLHGIPTDCPQPLGRMLECSELTFVLLGKIIYPVNSLINPALKGLST